VSPVPWSALPGPSNVDRPPSSKRAVTAAGSGYEADNKLRPSDAEAPKRLPAAGLDGPTMSPGVRAPVTPEVARRRTKLGNPVRQNCRCRIPSARLRWRI
jgi:hypothetical protein